MSPYHVYFLNEKEDIVSRPMGSNCYYNIPVPRIGEIVNTDFGKLKVLSVEYSPKYQGTVEVLVTLESAPHE
jgi:hypothetical protein